MLTLAPVYEAFCQLGGSYVFDDMRVLPLGDGLYNVVVCVSTIEHIGMEDTSHGGDMEYSPPDTLAVMRKLARVLPPGGRLLHSGSSTQPQHRSCFDAIALSKR